jgi:phosphatidylglycerol:prolipoprotein diacylglycerol transferase
MGLGRLGNFIDGQIVGSITDVWWSVKFPDVDGFRHPVVLYDGFKNLLLIPVLILMRYLRPPRGVILGTFLVGYGFLRIFIDFFREYRSDFFGLPPGQEFNIGMTLAGVSLIIWAYRRKHVGVRPLTLSAISGSYSLDVRKTTRLKRLIFRVILIAPLVIPSDWTQDVPQRYGDRHEGMSHSRLYPEIHTITEVDEPRESGVNANCSRSRDMLMRLTYYRRERRRQSGALLWPHLLNSTVRATWTI